MMQNLYGIMDGRGYEAPVVYIIEIAVEQAVFQGSGSFNIPGFREEPGI